MGEITKEFVFDMGYDLASPVQEFMDDWIVKPVSIKSWVESDGKIYAEFSFVQGAGGFKEWINSQGDVIRRSGLF